MIRYITKILSVSQGVVGADHRSFLDVVDLPALAAAMAGLRTALADGAATNPVLGVEEDHALIAVNIHLPKQSRRSCLQALPGK